MNLLENIKTALRMLIGHKLRTFLTLLGIIIGIFAVIVLVSLGYGVKTYILHQMRSWGMGTRYLEIHPFGEHEFPLFGFLESKLDYKDVELIEKRCPSIEYVDPRIIRSGEVKYRGKTIKVEWIIGVSENYPKMINHPVEIGKYFSSSEVKLKKRVCLLGKKTSEELFDSYNPIGEHLIINEQRFKVIGVLKEKGSAIGMDFDKIIIIPVSCAEILFKTKKLLEIGAVVKDEKMIEQAKNETTKILLRKYKKGEFRIDTQSETLKMVGNITNALTAAVAGIAAISLLVGGIGVMNIMLISVTDRFREIGLRKAIGATKLDIFIQFLTESLVVTLIGGLIGIILGIISALIILKLLGMLPVVTGWAVITAFCVATIVGISSGLYPAVKAANLNPVEAIRYE